VTYARARLLVGITGVGTWVVIAAVFLAAGGASLLPGPDAAFGAQAGALAAVIGIYVLVSLPFDLLGGLILPGRHGRPVPSASRWVAGWVRGVVVQSIVMAGAVGLMIWAGRGAGDAAALGVAALVALVIGLGRLPLARAVARLGAPVPAPHGAHTMAAGDVGFTGAITGIPGRSRVVLPEAWRQQLGDLFDIEVARRRAMSGAAYALGIALALAWTVGGVALALALPGGGADGVAAIVTTGAWFTLWSFAGLLVLPSVSRPAVMAGDAAAAGSYPHADVAAVIRDLDRLQDDEPERPGSVEVIFHPIPGAERRIQRLGTATSGVRPWHVARLALPMSWCCLGFMGRAVHCNAGRPELWVMLPAD
jgi:hypothetical protein